MVNHVGSQEESNGIRWIKVTIGDVNGWIPTDTVVTITGESETTGEVVWWPVVDETGDQGWVEASALEPLTSGPSSPPSTQAP